jgi:peptidoglycan/LPS O-acetylase OafA/YrhL
MWKLKSATADYKSSMSPDISVKSHFSRFYRPELDIMRFFAFLMVFFSHVWPHKATVIVNRLGVPTKLTLALIDSGAFGVFVFFMLSSYLITELLLREKDRTKTIHIRAYYVRRILRIWPLYFLFLGLAIVIGLVVPIYRLPAREIAMMMLLSGNWYFAQYGWGVGFVYHLWSISVEEQFYLVWPIFLKFGSHRTLKIGCAAFALLSILSLCFLSTHNRLEKPVIFVNSFVVCWFFALGGITAIVVRGRTRSLPFAMRFLLIFLSILLFLLATLLGVHSMSHISSLKLVLGYLLAGIGCLSVFFGFLGATIAPWADGLVYLGKISYGLYVFHVLCALVIEWFAKHILHHEHWPLTFPCTLLLTIMCAWLSYRFVESPFLRLKERFVFVESRRV